MSRTFLERIRSGEWWLEQCAHWWVGDLIGSLAGAIVVWLSGSWFWAGITAILAGAISAAIRELVQNLGDDDNNIPDSIADWFFWTLGGVRSSATFLVVWGAS